MMNVLVPVVIISQKQPILWFWIDVEIKRAQRITINFFENSGRQRTSDLDWSEILGKMQWLNTGYSLVSQLWFNNLEKAKAIWKWNCLVSE